jgi:hypothetical protein
MKLLLFLVMFAMAIGSSAQKVIDVTNGDGIGRNAFPLLNGEAFVNTKFVNLTAGSPYFKDEWLKAVLVSSTGTEYRDVQARIDLMENRVHYLDNGVELVTETPLKEIVVTDGAGNNYRFVHSGSLLKDAKPVWYLWLSTGKASLYKQFEKSVFEEKPFGSATTEQTIRTKETYIILYNNALLEVKKIRDLPSVLANKKTELEAFLRTRDDRNASMDDRMTAIIEYYNSLLK